MVSLLYLPPWSVDYSYEIKPNNVRSGGTGRVRQRGLSHRRIMMAQVTRQLIGMQLPYFEGFISSIINNGAGKFIDSFADQNGLNTGEVRIYQGKYDVIFNGRDAVISCELEVFR